MKKEYQNLIENYVLDVYSDFQNKTEGIEKNKQIAEEYLKKYWLSQSDYEKIWKPIQDQIFIHQDSGLPELLFSDKYEMLALRGGCIFTEEDFEQLKECMVQVGNKYFVIVENHFGNRVKPPTFQMKYPVNISWQELTSGGPISSILLSSFIQEYFVFGESPAWGKYSANDYIHPLDIIGFKPEYSTLFKEVFKQPQEEWDEIKEWLPPAYRERIAYP